MASGLMPKLPSPAGQKPPFKKSPAVCLESSRLATLTRERLSKTGAHVTVDYHWGLAISQVTPPSPMNLPGEPSPVGSLVNYGFFML